MRYSTTFGALWFNSREPINRSAIARIHIFPRICRKTAGQLGTTQEDEHRGFLRPLQEARNARAYCHHHRGPWSALTPWSSRQPRRRTNRPGRFVKKDITKPFHIEDSSKAHRTATEDNSKGSSKSYRDATQIDGDWVTESNCTVWHNFHYKQISLTEITQEHQLFFRILRRSASRIAVHHRWKNYHPTLLQYSPLDGLDNRPGLDQQGTSRGEDVRSQPCSRRPGEDRCFKMATHQIPR